MADTNWQKKDQFDKLQKGTYLYSTGPIEITETVKGGHRTITYPAGCFFRIEYNYLYISAYDSKLKFITIAPFNYPNLVVADQALVKPDMGKPIVGKTYKSLTTFSRSSRELDEKIY